MSESIKTDPEFLEKLKFRRQFVLGPGGYSPGKYWNTAKLQHGLILSVHDEIYVPRKLAKKFDLQFSVMDAEKEIATEQISPFNCRLLIETCLKVPREDRMTPDYEFFMRVIKELWPEVLSEPINPGPRGFGLVKKKLRENMPVSVIRTIRKLVN